MFHRKLSCTSIKSEAIITYVLGPLANDELPKDLCEATTVTITVDTAYRISVKLIPFLGWFFHPMKVVKIKLREVHLNFFLNWYSGGWSSNGSTQHCGHQQPIVPAPGDYDDAEIDGMIGRGNRSTRRKPAPVPLCPPQTPHATRTRTRTATVGSQRLTA
jgi:hypothetical protein